ncbi:putative uncharacterized protein [Prevotella sp. CAG:520]|nr:putative uncharacterized protein [Prevotella sp. CAG:520]
MKHLQSIEFVFINTCLLNTVLLHLSLPQKQHIMPDTLTFTSVHTIPGIHVSAAFTIKTSEVFKEENDIAPIIINDKTKYIPWGGDNQMPYKISALTILQYINFINNKPIGRIKYALN